MRSEGRGLKGKLCSQLHLHLALSQKTAVEKLSNLFKKLNSVRKGSSLTGPQPKLSVPKGSSLTGSPPAMGHSWIVKSKRNPPAVSQPPSPASSAG